MKDVTLEVNGALRRLGVKDGVCLVFVPHTTAGLIVNENADAAVPSDMLDWLDEAVPQGRPFRHEEGNSPAHIKATLVGRDPATDLALLKVEGLNAPAMPRAKVADLKPGQIVLAIGRPGGLKATFGTISAVSSSWRGWRGSEIEHLIQTNAPLYPGFSGGPLVDVDGRAVGMNSWVFGRGDGRAIAMDVAERVVQSLRTDGRIKRAYLGVGTQQVPLPDAVKAKVKQESGLLVITVDPGSPADRAGIMQGDTLVAIAGASTATLDDLFSKVRALKVGAVEQVKVIRAGEPKELSLTVGEANRQTT